MLSLVRHNISLLASLVVALVGIVVAVYGLVQFGGALTILITINVHPLADASGFKPVAAMMIVGQHGLTALAGIVLTYFATRSFIGSWRAGPPDDDTVVGRSPVSKAVALLIYGAGALYGSYGIIFGMGPLLDDYHLAIKGDRTTARIVASEPAPDIHWDVQRVTYEFVTRDGQTVRGTANAFSFPAQQMRERGWVEVTYDVEEPARSEVDFRFSMQFALYFFFGQLVFLVIGIWGFAKNASAMASLPPADRAPPPGPVRPGMVVAQSPAAPRRATFGRRGA